MGVASIAILAFAFGLQVAFCCPSPAKLSGNRCICRDPAPICVGPACIRGETKKGYHMEVFPLECTLCRCVAQGDSKKIPVSPYVAAEKPRLVPKLPKDQVCHSNFLTNQAFHDVLTRSYL